MDSLPLIARAGEHGGRVAIVDPDRSFSYAELLEASARVAGALGAGRVGREPMIEGGADRRVTRARHASTVESAVCRTDPPSLTVTCALRA